MTAAKPDNGGPTSTSRTPSSIEVFVTVGTQLPFDRLLIAVDEWAARTPQARVTAQTCSTEDGYKPKHFARVVEMLDADDCAKLMQRADVTIAHAGMGTILTALDLNKRLIVMPRRAYLKEHRNDHQWATTQRLQAAGLVEVAESVEDLCNLLASLTATSNAACEEIAAAAKQTSESIGLPSAAKVSALNGSSPRALVDALVTFVRGAAPARRRRLRAATISNTPLAAAEATATPAPELVN